MMYKNYIWDLGGTLLDNYESSSHAFAAALWQARERVILHDQAYQALKISTDYAIDKYARDIPDFLTLYRELEAKELEKPLLFDGAKEVLQVIVDNGRSNYMISHRNNQVLDILKKAGISQYFTEIVTSDNGFSRKPAPDSIQYLINKYKLELNQTAMVGDREIDVEAGNSAGVQTIFFDSQLTSEKANQNIKNLKELL
ncbi:MAG: HAD-IA family hydrolase [Streptococcaceae bacterium]|nr:HAD-IA family hydrolase [Streptococcaceae bacterium]MCL2681123.1 HAD-IA family hydrolase [Streptococcaceae bacterium]MCL2858154.1 HAD-IA family hydrolase [Streptococcaceae bacterium]